MINEQDRLRIIGQRYRQRRVDGLTGWACGESYDRKIRNALALVEKYRVPKGGRFLELGCGAGNITLEMARRGFDAHGIDIVPEAIEWAMANASKAGIQACFHTGSVALLQPFQDGFFDVVFDGDCLWMVLGEDRRDCFRNVFRVLRPGGIFFARAHVVTNSFNEPYVVARGVSITPTTLLRSVQDVPMYQYSLEDAFLSEIQTAGFDVYHHWIKDSDRGDKDAPPFYKGVMSVEAGKPENC